jgi:hypothetical protein
MYILHIRYMNQTQYVYIYVKNILICVRTHDQYIYNIYIHTMILIMMIALLDGFTIHVAATSPHSDP